MDKTQAALKYLRGIFPMLGEAKTKEGVFAGPQICERLCNDAFDCALCSSKEKMAWKAF